LKISTGPIFLNAAPFIVTPCMVTTLMLKCFRRLKTALVKHA